MSLPFPARALAPAFLLLLAASAVAEPSRPLSPAELDLLRDKVCFAEASTSQWVHMIARANRMDETQAVAWASENIKDAAQLARERARLQRWARGELAAPGDYAFDSLATCHDAEGKALADHQRPIARTCLSLAELSNQVYVRNVIHHQSEEAVLAEILARNEGGHEQIRQIVRGTYLAGDSVAAVRNLQERAYLSCRIQYEARP